ncbi:hypothetical protein Hanom_Chr05g00407981 [Helianthus anomalus]
MIKPYTRVSTNTTHTQAAAPPSLVTCKACSKVSTIMLSEFTSCPVLITKNSFHQLIYSFIHAMGSYPKS